MTGPTGEVHAAKQRWRSRILAARRALPPEVHAAEATALAAAVREFSGTVCGYLPVGSEPGSFALLDALRAAGCEVLLPVVPEPDSSGPPGPLDWGRYAGATALRSGPLGLREPSGPRLGAAAVAAANVLLVPALAVDRTGVRLGRGAGYYDSTLLLARPDALVAAVVRDVELVAALPAEPHDMRVTAVLTPGAGLLTLGG